jgi:CheY-like chemotaxis protein
MPYRVLLVEDDALIGPLLAETLIGLGYEVCGIEATEAGAVAAAARHRPDLMIVDMNLADGSGIAAVERITRTGPVPHVFMSGHAWQDVMPGRVLLTKPFREADLIRAIGRALTPAASPA